MNIVLWIVQSLLALAFLAAGINKLSQSKEQLVTMADWMEWSEDFSPRVLKAIGLLEILGAIGLIVPMVTGILTILTPLAAGGLVLNMIGASFTHIRRNETSYALVSATLGLFALFVAVGRFVLIPIF